MKYCNPAVDEVLLPLPDSVTVCATVNESGEEQVITDLMIRQACQQMDDHQIWPFAQQGFAGALRSLSPKSATIIPFPG